MQVASATDGVDGDGCQCASGYDNATPGDFGTPCVVVDACVAGTDNCDRTNGSCTNGASDSWQCECDPLFYLPDSWKTSTAAACQACSFEGCATCGGPDACSTCKPGYFGPTCRPLPPYDEYCVQRSEGVDGAGCVCQYPDAPPTGYRNSGTLDGSPDGATSCVDVDECSEGLHACGDGTCHNQRGQLADPAENAGYTCTCPSGQLSTYYKQNNGTDYNDFFPACGE